MDATGGASIRWAPLRWARAAFRLAVLGATLGAALDAMHVATQTTRYPEPFVAGLAWWVFPLFACAGIAIGLARPVWERVLGARTPRPSHLATTFAVSFFVVAYLASGVLPAGTVAKCAALAVIFAAAWVLFDRSALGIALAIGTAVIGTLVEITLVRMGMFAYLAPDFAGVAMWLPLLYMTTAITVGKLGKRMVDPA